MVPTSKKCSCLLAGPVYGPRAGALALTINAREVYIFGTIGLETDTRAPDSTAPYGVGAVFMV